MQVRVGVELPGDKIVDFALVRGIDICQSVYQRVVTRGILADSECECKHELIITTELQKERWRACRIGILGRISSHSSIHQSLVLSCLGNLPARTQLASHRLAA